MRRAWALALWLDRTRINGIFEGEGRKQTGEGDKAEEEALLSELH